MLNQTGSVYLDAPKRPSRQAVAATKKRRSRSAMANVMLAIGLVSLTLSSLIAGVRFLVVDSDPIMRAFEDTLNDSIARAELEGEVAAGIEDGLVGAEMTAVAAAFDLDVSAEADRIAGTVLDDATVRDELRALVAEVHRRVVIESSEQVLDLGPLTEAVLAVITQEAPRLAPLIPSDATLWSVDASSFPDLTAPAHLMNQAQLFTLIPALLVILAAALHPRRHRVAAWIGRWALTTSLACGLVAIALPYLAGSLSGYSAAEIATRTLSTKLLAPAVLAGIMGVGLVTFAAVMKHREQREVADVGAAAAMGGYDEPAMMPSSQAPTLDIGSRGLVDVSHPLTNI